MENDEIDVLRTSIQRAYNMHFRIVSEMKWADAPTLRERRIADLISFAKLYKIKPIPKVDIFSGMNEFYDLKQAILEKIMVELKAQSKNEKEVIKAVGSSGISMGDEGDSDVPKF